MTGRTIPRVMVVELQDDTEFADAAHAVGSALAGHGLRKAYGAVGTSAEAVLAAVRDRDDPPHGWTVERFDPTRQWVVRDPSGRLVGGDWTVRAEAVREAWADRDRMVGQGTFDPGDMVWLGDLSGWTFEDGAVQHRCGFERKLTGAGSYLANVVVDVVRGHVCGEGTS